MTITDVNLVSETGADDESGGRSYTEVFAVEFTAGYSTAALIANTDARLPKRGWHLGQSAKSTSSDSSVYVSNVTPTLADSSQGTPIGSTTGVALYTVQYKTPSLTVFDKQLAPLARPAQIHWGGSEATEARKYDIEGTPLANSAGDFYQDLPEFYLRGGEVTITFNVAYNPADTCVDFSFTSNDSAWYGVAEGNALLGKIEATNQYEVFQGTEYNYWQITYPISFRRDGWRYKTFDYGYRQLVDNEDAFVGMTEVILDKNGAPSPVPSLLDGAGRALADQTEAPVTWPDDDGFQVYEATSWGGLSIPNPFA